MSISDPMFQKFTTFAIEDMVGRLDVYLEQGELEKVEEGLKVLSYMSLVPDTGYSPQFFLETRQRLQKELEKAKQNVPTPPSRP